MAHKKMVDEEESLHKNIREHQDLVAKFEKVQQIDLGVFKQMQKAKQPDFAKRFLHESEELFVRVANIENSARSTVRKISDELVQDIKDSIVGPLTLGVQCLEHAVSKFPRSETTENCLKMIRSIDKVGVAYSLIKANSMFYFCPQVMQHLQIYGWRKCFPKARFDQIDIETTDAGLDMETNYKSKPT